MSDFQRDMQKEALLPILLGDSFAAHSLSLQIYLRCGVRSYICDSKRGFLSFIDPTSRFFDLISVSEGAAMLCALENIAANTDYLPILVPCGERFCAFVEENIEFLEPRFIIASKNNVFDSAPFSAILKGGGA